MTDLGFLRDLVIVFAAALVVVAILGRLRIPSVAGFIVAGALVGPNALGLIADVHRVETLAEIGVVLLLFGIGLELSLDRIRRLWRPIVFGGAIQVGVTILAVLGVAIAFGDRPGHAAFLGCVIAVSSTAIVLRGLSARGELDAPHGRLAVGILVFQDLCVVPMILALPFLAGTGGTATEALLTLGAAVGVLVGVMVAARLVVPALLGVASRTRQRDVFILAVALVCMGTAWAVSSAGVSVALGAFLAGLVVSGSQYRHQALADIIPLREVLASVFFVSVGMLLDVRAVGGQAVSIAGLLAAIVAGKFVLVFLTAAVMRLPLRVCVLTGAALCQVGEFSFILLRAAQGTGLVESSFESDLTVAVILSMLVTPFALALGPRIAAGAGRVGWLTRLLQVRIPAAEPAGETLSDHVIIAGYGITGQELAQSLETTDTPYVVVDLNADNVRLAASDGVPVYFGDVTSIPVLERLGIADARELVVSINDPEASARAVQAARRCSRDLPIIVRTFYVEDIGRLLASGATQVVAGEAEAAAEVASRVLRSIGAVPELVDTHLERIRARRSERGKAGKRGRPGLTG